LAFETKASIKGVFTCNFLRISRNFPN